MLDHRTATLALADFSPFSFPPKRPSGSDRRTDANRGPTRLIRAIRDEVERATRPDASLTPRIANYPY